MKQFLFNHLKNISGWSTKKKFLIISVDDYGNVRIDSKKAKAELEKKGITPQSHFDNYDSLETREDLECLFEVLDAVKDKNGNSAIFTPYALPCNINFEYIIDNGFSEYVYELLPQTFDKLSGKDLQAYSGTWELWKEGIEKGLMKPQFHGREHLNLFIIGDLLKQQNSNLLELFKQRSYISIPEHKNYKQKWTAAYSFDSLKETKGFYENIVDGIKCFEKVYGYSPSVFIPPAQSFPPDLEVRLPDVGIKYIDKPFLYDRYVGDGKYKKEFHRLGDGEALTTLIRNVNFEPSSDNRDWVNFALKQIEAAFFWNKPAHINSHRVNYSGYVDEKNREKGLSALRELLQKVVEHWPEVEFISADELGKIITAEKGK